MRREISTALSSIAAIVLVLTLTVTDALALTRPPVVQRDTSGRVVVGVSANGRYLLTSGTLEAITKRIDLVQSTSITLAFQPRNPQLTADGSAMLYQDLTGAVYRYNFATKATSKLTFTAIPAAAPSCFNVADFQLKSINATGSVLAFIGSEGCTTKQWVWIYDVGAKGWRSPNRKLPPVPAGSLGWQSNEVVLNATGRVAAMSAFTNVGCTKCIRVFAYNWTTNTATVVSTKSTGAALTDGNAMAPSISPDGTVVSFRSNATGVVAGITTVKWRVYVKNLALRTVKAISDKESVNTFGASDAFGYTGPQLLANGTYLALLENRPGSTNVVGPHPVLYRISDKSSAVLDNTSTGGRANADAISVYGAAAAKRVAFGSYATNFTRISAGSAPRVFVSTFV